ncbi:hypothetical protein ZYGR_0H00180 [Zygosaccharomyces rouxii]|uniref:ZYRO0B04444p n=2 Tax=Zygosaccharomyces rouxii TaxID=4956 RepID=C5DR00_ZYGRC|nr:uncharacterized protein ZYRO0B04444g [Zygosaccharomyces rouxii]KAH9200240.1 WD40-repeat-containing domain protein [Zygosaccharomyces rouxii]GAV47179.1 hypothetical protein ZYGR_0H00180 [Zygosaccharomyces rouxii]CAR26211.1 ZYRO0B04444p [Zygosaccharomyces rouxii]
MSAGEHSRKRTRTESETPTRDVDEEITDPSSEEEDGEHQGAGDGESDEDLVDSEEEFKGENPADKRRRLAKEYLKNLKEEAHDVIADGEGLQGENKDVESVTVDDYNNFDAAELDRDILASRLKQDVAEQHGRVFRFFAHKLLLSEAKTTFTRVGENNLTCISCFQPAFNKFQIDDERLSSRNKGKIFAYTASKDLQITKYDITDFDRRPQKLAFTKGGPRFFPQGKYEIENTTEGHYDEILTLAASPDGKYVVSGGKDRKLIVWSAESLAPVKVIPTKDRRGEVLGLTFRKNTDQLYASCADYKIRTYSINQASQLETLYGHHDIVVDISALSMERCVTVGSRDKTAMLWKIPDETRLTFRGGEEIDKLEKRWLRQHATEKENGELEYPDASEMPVFYGEGSIDVVTMVDDSHFITGSDNGNLCLWSLAKKKPVFVERTAHGVIPPPGSEQISGESNEQIRQRQLQDKRISRPYWITAVHAIPYSNVFFSGSWNGSIKVWKILDNLRGFELLGELPNCNGVVNKIQVVEAGKHGKEVFRVLASVGKEHKFGRWINKLPKARNGIYSAVITQGNF